MHEVSLPGCTPEPLMGYLKALGVFRLVAEQADPSATLCWKGGIACLTSTLDRDGLVAFFRDEYRPTPIVGPWGARSGFFPGGNESSAREALEAIKATTEPRFAAFRETIATVQRILRELEIHEGDDIDLGENQIQLMRACRNQLPDEVLNWLDAVYVLTTDAAKFPPLLGTGGNEGSGSYMSNFAQIVRSVLLNRPIDGAIAAALFAAPIAALADVTVGQFSPGGLNGPNSGVGFRRSRDKSRANPWDFLLAIEGTLMFAGRASRRLGNETEGKAAFPFTVDPTPAGYGSAADGENVRAEIWMPEWERPITLAELAHLLGEGSAQLGRRQARTGLDFARAAVTLGVCRGVGGFHRYSVVMRNGLSYFAAYLGRFPVREVPPARLLDQLDGWLGPYRRLAGGENVPPRFSAAVRRIDAAIFDVCRYEADAERMQAVLRAVGQAERELVNGPKVREEHSGLRPLGGLSSNWLDACDDGSSEFRLAASLAFLPGRKRRHRPFRMYLEAVLRSGRDRWQFDDTAPGVVWSKADLTTNLSAVLVRRLLDGTAEEPQLGDEDAERSLHPLWAPDRFRPALADVLAFLNHQTDDHKLAELLWSLPTVSVRGGEFRFRGHTQPVYAVPADFAVLKLVFLSGPAVRPGTTTPLPIRNELRAATLLRAGRLDEAVEVACRRLQAAGLPTFVAGPIAGRVKRVQGFTRDPARARRLLAAMLFPLRNRDIDRLLVLSVRELESPRT